MKYNPLGLNLFKYNQATLLLFSLFILGINYLLGSSFFFWLFLFGMLIIANLIWYIFSDIKWNRDYFLIEKFLKKRIIASDKFLKVEKLFFNVFVITFTDSKFYYVGDHRSIFENSIDITNKIRADIFEP